MNTQTEEITNSSDYIDVRDVIARFEELESACADEGDEIDPATEDEREELTRLTALLEELKGNGGDEDWRGDWYPISLIRDSYFADYAQELAEDIGAINKDATWPNNYIDWDRACEALRQDYSTVDFDGIEYWYR